MSTRFPVTLPALPDDRWNVHRPNGYRYEEIPDEDGVPAFYRSRYEIDAASGAEAELRVLAYVDGSYQDDLRGAAATAAHEISPGRWAVDLDIRVTY